MAFFIVSYGIRTYNKRIVSLAVHIGRLVTFVLGLFFYSIKGLFFLSGLIHEEGPLRSIGL